VFKISFIKAEKNAIESSERLQWLLTKIVQQFLKCHLT